MGLGDSKWSGPAGSFYRSVGIDGHSIPGALTVQQKLSLESGTTVTELCLVRVACSNGYSFWFSSTSGKIWARSSSGTWTLAYTTTATAGGVACLGAMEYNGFIFWATESRLHMIAVADADDSWSNAHLNWANFTCTNPNYHPMAIQDLTLFIGDGNLVASVDDTVVATDNTSFNDNALDITAGLIIKTMIDYRIDLLIGTINATTLNRTQIIDWDCVSPSWNTSDPIDEVGINAFIRDGDYLYVNAGRAGNIYYYNGSTLAPFQKVPGTYSNTQYGTINPQAVGNYKGVPIFGFSNGGGDPALEGVYSFGAYSKNYPKVLDLSWVISPDVTTGVTIGAILVADFDILVAWKYGSSYGVDKIDYANKYANAYFETRFITPTRVLRHILWPRDEQKVLQQVEAFYASLPANTNITLSYSINDGAFVAMTGINDTSACKVFAQPGADQVGSLRIKVGFTVHNNDAPVMEDLGVTMTGVQSSGR